MADGFLDKMKRVIGIDDDPGEEYEDDPVSEQPEPKHQEQQPSPAYAPRNNGDFVQPKVEHSNKGVSMQNATVNMAARRQQWKMLITEPKKFDDCPKLVDNLRANKPVIINIEQLERETARKIFDFLSGATYAIEGKVQKISENIFVFAPNNVDILISPNEVRGQSAADNVYMPDAPWR